MCVCMCVCVCVCVCECVCVHACMHVIKSLSTSQREQFSKVCEFPGTTEAWRGGRVKGQSRSATIADQDVLH